MMLQVPTPPLPPDPVIVTSGPPIEAIVFIVFAIVAGVLLYPVLRGWGRRIEGRGSKELQGEIDILHERLAGIEAMETRLEELESRVEFSERLLARQAEGSDAPGQRP